MHGKRKKAEKAGRTPDCARKFGCDLAAVVQCRDQPA
jgi:hypothetical protein